MNTTYVHSRRVKHENLIWFLNSIIWLFSVIAFISAHTAGGCPVCFDKPKEVMVVPGKRESAISEQSSEIRYIRRESQLDVCAVSSCDGGSCCAVHKAENEEVQPGEFPKPGVENNPGKGGAGTQAPKEGGKGRAGAPTEKEINKVLPFAYDQRTGDAS